MTISSGQTVDKDDLNSDTNKVSTMNANQTAGGKSGQVDVVVFDLDSSTPEADRKIEFTPQDDLELQMIGLTVNGGFAGRAFTAELTVVGGVTKYLLDETVSVSHTLSGSSKESTRTTFTSATGRKVFLVRGVAYALTLSAASASATDLVQGTLYLRARRRRR